MKKKYALLTQEDFDKLLKSDKWKIEEVDLATVKLTPLVERKHQLLGAFTSGDSTITRPLNGQPAVLGMDVFVHEENPWRNQGEGDVNVYHYVVARTGRLDFPYLIRGPYRTETLVAHWPSGLPLEPYKP